MTAEETKQSSDNTTQRYPWVERPAKPPRKIPPVVVDSLIGTTAGSIAGFVTLTAAQTNIPNDVVTQTAQAVTEVVQLATQNNDSSPLLREIPTGMTLLQTAVETSSTFIQANPEITLGAFVLAGIALCTTVYSRKNKKPLKIVRIARETAGIGAAIGVKGAATTAGAIFGTVAGYAVGIGSVAIARTLSVPQTVDAIISTFNGYVGETVHYGAPQSIASGTQTIFGTLPQTIEAANAYAAANPASILGIFALAGLCTCAWVAHKKSSPLALRAAERVAGHNMNHHKFLR